MSNILIYPQDRRRHGRPEPLRPAHIDTPDDPLMGLGWFIAAVGLLCMLSAIALTTLNLS
ncbi:MAG: hypothetical protein ACYCZX_17065 [Rhodospirillaceae bacterium]